MARTTSVFDVDASPNAERIRQLNAKAFTVARQSGAMAMETYQQTVRALLALGRTVPDSAGVKPFSRPDTLPTRITGQFAQAPIDVWTSATANTTRYAAHAVARRSSPWDIAEDMAEFARGDAP